jgi:hypothetical protein
MTQDTNALRKALEDAADLLKRVPKVTHDMYVGRDRESYGGQALALEKRIRAVLASPGSQEAASPSQREAGRADPMRYHYTIVKAARRAVFEGLCTDGDVLIPSEKLTRALVCLRNAISGEATTPSEAAGEGA